MCKAAREMRHEVLHITVGKQQEAKMHMHRQQQLLRQLGPAQIQKLATLAKELGDKQRQQLERSRTQSLELRSAPGNDDDDDNTEGPRSRRDENASANLAAAKPDGKAEEAETRKPLHACSRAPRAAAPQKTRKTVFVEDVTVIEYDLSSEEREEKRQAFRAIGRRRHMKRLRPDFKEIPNDEFGEMMFASNSWRCEKPEHPETPPTPMNVQYASSARGASTQVSPPSSHMSPSSPLFLDADADAHGGYAANGRRTARARSKLDAQAQRRQRQQIHQQQNQYPQIRRATNVTRGTHAVAKRKRAATDVSYWDMFLATILFIKLLATVVLSTAKRSSADENPSRKSVTYP